MGGALQGAGVLARRAPCGGCWSGVVQPAGHGMLCRCLESVLTARLQRAQEAQAHAAQPGSGAGRRGAAQAPRAPPPARQRRGRGRGGGCAGPRGRQGSAERRRRAQQRGPWRGRRDVSCRWPGGGRKPVTAPRSAGACGACRPCVAGRAGSIAMGARCALVRLAPRHQTSPLASASKGRKRGSMGRRRGAGGAGVHAGARLQGSPCCRCVPACVQPLNDELPCARARGSLPFLSRRNAR